MLIASGFYVRDANHEDIEDEIDVEGDDEEVFGQAQFTEVDILSASRPLCSNRESEVTIELEETSGSIPLTNQRLSDSQPVCSSTLLASLSHLKLAGTIEPRADMQDLP